MLGDINDLQNLLKFAIWKIILNADHSNFSKVGKLRNINPQIKSAHSGYRDQAIGISSGYRDQAVGISGISKRKVPCSDYRNILESKSLTIFNGWKRDYKVRVHWF